LVDEMNDLKFGINYDVIYSCWALGYLRTEAECLELLLKARKSLLGDKTGVMFLKEVIQDDNAEFTEDEAQGLIIRSVKWHEDLFEKAGYMILH
jgi:hypothetical protein